MKNKKLLGIIAVILASICYGVMPIFSNACLSGGFPVEFLGKLFGESIPAYMLESPENALSNSSVVAFSMGFGCIISLIVLASKRKLSALKVKPRELMSMSLYGGVAFFATCLLLTYAYQRMDKGSAIVLHFSYPAVSCIASTLFFSEKLTARKLIAIVPALAGVCLVSSFGGASNVWGPVFALLSALTYSVYILAGRYSAYANVDSSVSTVYVTGTASLVGFIMAFITGEFSLPANWFIVALLAMGGITGYLVGLRLLLFGIRTLGSGTASMLNTFEPVMASVCGIVVLGETFSLQKGIGYALVLGAALLVVSSTVSEGKKLRSIDSN